MKTKQKKKLSTITYKRDSKLDLPELETLKKIQTISEYVCLCEESTYDDGSESVTVQYHFKR